MAMIPATDWRSRVSGLDARDARGEVYVWPWLFGSDDQVAIDIGDQLEDGEEPTDVAVSLRRLYAQGEQEDADADAKKVGDVGVSGSMVFQRLQDLERGRYYRLEVLHGAAGNRRGASLLIRCMP